MQRELPTNTQDWTRIGQTMPRGADDKRLRASATRESTVSPLVPINEFEALMITAPGDEPKQTMVEQLVLRDAVADCIDQLSPRSQFVIAAVHAERLSYRQLAKRLGYSVGGAHKLVTQAEAELRTLLLKHPTTKEHLMPKPTTWNEAARAAVISLAPSGAGMADDIALNLINRKVEKLRSIVNSKQLDDKALGSAIQTIGIAAACMLDNRGLWDIDEIVELLCRKQHDYGHGNILAFGMTGVAVRDSDKVARWNNLVGMEGSAEPAIDALLDMVGYGAIAYMLLADTFMLELAE